MNNRINNGEIREMTLNDLNSVMLIEESSFSSPWSRYSFEYDLIHNPHARYFIFILSDTIIGYAGLWVLHDVGHIVNMAVYERYRRQGVARQLLEYLMDYGRSMGVTRFTLEVRKSNLSAIQLYKSYGFVDVGTRPRYYQDDGEDAVIMWTPDEDGEIRFS